MDKSLNRVLLLAIALICSFSMLSACKKQEKDATKEDTTIINATTTSISSELIKLNQDELVKVMGLGWNLGNQLEALKDGTPDETSWGNPVVTEDLIKAVKTAGFKSVRIPISFFSKIGMAPEYTIDSIWLDRIQEVVDYCINNDLYVVINIHGDGYQTIDGGWLYCDSTDQDAIKAKLKAVWKQIATRFKDYDGHLIYESMNEISDMNYKEPKQELYDNINSYNQIFLDTVRQSGGYNNMRWVLIPGWNTDITYTAGDYGFRIPTDDYRSDQIPEDEKRIMISAHYYAPWDFCGGESGQITEWGEDAVNIARTSVLSGQSMMASQFKLLSDTFISQGYPVVIGEFSVIDKTEDNPENQYYREQYVHKLCENSLKFGCVPMYWDNGNTDKYGTGLFDRTTYKVTGQGMIDAMLEVYNPVEGTYTSTGISMDATELQFAFGDLPTKLTATIEPLDSTDVIRWSSSDETIVTVSSSGVVRPQNIGTATVIATAGGNKAECMVTVKEATNLKVMLYAIETKAWSSVQSEEAATITKDGGTYTLSLKGNKDLLGNIGSLFIKDLTVQREITKTSIFSSAQIKLESVKFNGVECKLLIDSNDDAIKNNTFDYCLLNQWDKDSAMISGVDLNEDGSYYFTNGGYQEENTIEVTFTVTDVVK